MGLRASGFGFGGFELPEFKGSWVWGLGFRLWGVQVSSSVSRVSLVLSFTGFLARGLV